MARRDGRPAANRDAKAGRCISQGVTDRERRPGQALVTAQNGWRGKLAQLRTELEVRLGTNRPSAQISNP